MLGSGLNGTVVANELLRGQQKVVMIDAGLTEKDRATQTEVNIIKKKFTSPKFWLENKTHTYAKFTDWAGPKEKNFSAIGSLAQGGLSNLWAGDIKPYNSDELKNFVYGEQEIKSIAGEISSLLTGNTLSKSNNPKFKNSLVNYLSAPSKHLNDIKVTEPRNAVVLHKKSESLAHKSSENVVFNAKMELLRLIKNKNFFYKQGFLIEDISRHKDYYIIQARKTDSASKVLFKVKTIFCSLGVINTTKLVLRMENRFNKKLQLLNTPSASFILFNFKKNFENQKTLTIENIHSLASYTIKVHDNYISGNIFPAPVDLLAKYPISKMINNWTGKKLNELILPKIFLCNINFPSIYSNNSIFLNEKGNLEITAEKPLNSLEKDYLLTRKKLSLFFRSKGFFTFPIFNKLLKAGEDIHYGGTLPMSKKPGELECDSLGRLYGHESFYLTDPSSMSFLAGKGHTFNSMVQSTLIVQKYLKRIN